MNKRIKKIMATSLGLGVGLMSFVQTFALEPNEKMELSKQEIIEQPVESAIKSSDANDVLNKYGFTTETADIKDIPDNATVLKFNSNEEMEAYFKNLDQDFANQEMSDSPYTDKVLSQQTMQTRSVSPRSVSTIQRSTYKLFGATKCNLIANINVSTSGSSKTITGCSNSTNMSGYTLGMGWRQTSASHNISSTKKSVSVKGSGQLITYLLTEASKVEIARRNVDLSLNYSI